MSINSNTENMIQTFFKYGVKQSLSVEEFLQFRKQAVQEQLSGISENNFNNSEIDVTNVSSESCQPIVKTIPQKKDVSYKSSIVKQKADEQLNIIPTNEEIDNEDDVPKDFNDEEFLKIMRDIED